jgi:hypothetical protein
MLPALLMACLGKSQKYFLTILELTQFSELIK